MKLCSSSLSEIEKETGKKVYTILQLRLHSAIRNLREQIRNGPADKIYDLDLTYITSRGNWYHRSWKGDASKSGGIATNIGVHFFDMLTWVFGPFRENTVHVINDFKAGGLLKLERANIRWFLSIDYNDIPENVRKAGKRTYRSLLMGDQEIEFSDGFTDLHTESYREILAGRGFGISEARQSIDIVYQIRNAASVGLDGNYHPILDTLPEFAKK